MTMRRYAPKQLHVFPESHPEYNNDTYVQTNLAIMNVYIKNLYFMRKQRSELYSIVDFFSNIGGLMGLCCGLSILSVVELGYFFTLRLFYNVRMDREEEAC